ncbi:hypothetical protein B7463_g3797, partial [Scytalidium lignicola]
MSSQRSHSYYHEAPVVHNSRGAYQGSHTSSYSKSSGYSTMTNGHSSTSHPRAEEKKHRVPDHANKEVTSIYRENVVVTNHQKRRFDPAEYRYGQEQLEYNSPSRSRDSAKHKEEQVYR